MRKYAPKSEETIYPGQMKNNLTYMNSYPLQNSKYNQLPINFADRTNSSILNPKELAENIKKMVVEENHDKKLSRFFRSISSKPIISNIPVQFNEEKYDLKEDEIVKVCSSKVFEIKNYFNYLFEEEIEKANKRLMERNRQIQLKNKAAQISDIDNNNNHNFNPYTEPTIKNQQETILDPVHSKYSNPTKSFFPKEKQRLELSRGPSSKKNNYQYERY